ncbi:XK-related protein 5b [Brienomyrus brachyistius]|uniref:XK-related protein 5b n=1 Tax=Brienomyrus brachyistius TaxID=42636 RepID=UPI0020B213AC|nr:XK-related protein 5b [Brienomyrus brachyistius]
MKEHSKAQEMQTADRKVCWTAWCQVILFGWTVVIILAERTALVYCVVYYLWHTHFRRALLTFGLAVPGTVVQVLSFKWYREDGAQQKCCLRFVHILHLGIFKRLWDCMWCLWHSPESGDGLSAIVMQQADVSALRLLEALLLTLPQTVLQTYILLTTDEGILSPVFVCCALCLLSTSWALVLYSRACSLVRPGHLPMPPAALLCQLLWRASMLGARIASLMFFMRVFCGWICGIIGFHWLIASLWLVTQQTDICSSPWRWHLFNCVLGAVHVFFFLNVKDGPSRFRISSFYLVMLLENAALLLLASDFLSEATWDSMGVPAAVFCSFLLGITSLVLYYRFLHPKSTEISHHLWNGHLGITCLRGESSFSLGDKMAAVPSVPSQGNIPLTAVARNMVEHSGTCGAESAMQDGHHHWLLLRLALKTGNLAKINVAYGYGEVAAMMETMEMPEMKDVESQPPESESKDGIMPLSEGKENFQSVSEPSFTSDLTGDEEEEDEDLETESSLPSPVFDYRRASPEGKSVLEESLEPRYCPTESTTTLYFSADPQSPGSASYLGLERDLAVENLGETNALSGDAGLQAEARESPNRVNPRCRSPPKIESRTPEPTSPRFLVPRRQVVLSWKDKPERF